METLRALFATGAGVALDRLAEAAVHSGLGDVLALAAWLILIALLIGGGELWTPVVRVKVNSVVETLVNATTVLIDLRLKIHKARAPRRRCARAQSSRSRQVHSNRRMKRS
jgi:hypothetical protein